jgi:hypothetical protein
MFERRSKFQQQERLSVLNICAGFMLKGTIRPVMKGFQAESRYYTASI